MRSPLCLSPVTPESGIVEPEETAVARQRLCKYFPAATNTTVTIEKQLDVVFSMRSVSYQIPNICDWFFPEILVILRSHLHLGLPSGLFPLRSLT
jgi:hypothetical protein